MVAVNLRGTSGSGKSFLARRILALYSDRMLVGDKKILSCIYTKLDHPPLTVLGHYEADHGGGADMISREDGFNQLTLAAKIPCDLFWEGVIFSDEVPQTIALSRLQETHVIFLTTPIEQCLADIRARREARGNVKPLAEKNTVQRAATLDKVYHRLRLAQAPGIKVYRLDREEAYLRCKELLRL